MNLYREYHIGESETRWRKGKRYLHRRQTNSGYWRQRGSEIEHGTLSAKTIAPKLPTWLKQWGQSIAQAAQPSFESVRIGVQSRQRHVSGVGDTSIHSIYTELKENDTSWTFTIPWNSGSRAKVVEWTQQLISYLRLPLWPDDLEFQRLVFAPSAFGFLLHECLGHRLESDDFIKPISWKREWRDLGFDVFDVPGESEWLGFTPFDDAGTKTKSVRLLDGRTGDQKFLQAKTGNLRAVDWGRHALIRQRCLDVRLRTPRLLPSGIGNLHIEDVSMGETQGEDVAIFTNRQTISDTEGRRFRLPNLQLGFTPHILTHMSAFGDVMIHHPGGGCAKGGQRDLPVTFRAPSAWCVASKAITIRL